MNVDRYPVAGRGQILAAGKGQEPFQLALQEGGIDRDTPERFT